MSVFMFHPLYVPSTLFMFRPPYLCSVHSIYVPSTLFMFHPLYSQDQIITTVSFLTLNKFQFQLLLQKHLEKFHSKFISSFCCLVGLSKFICITCMVLLFLCVQVHVFVLCVIYYWSKYIMYKFLFYTRCFQHDHKASHLHVEVTIISNSHAILVQNLKYRLEIYCLLGTIPLKCISQG